MSEDSDYTSDNYPIADQHNVSAHQFPRSERPYQPPRRNDSQESREYFVPQQGHGYYQQSVYSQECGPGYDQNDYYPAAPRSDTDSEYLYYNSRPNSRPQSFVTDRWVGCTKLTAWR